jgi:PIN domain nuclease of toxin-antitoxin system
VRLLLDTHTLIWSVEDQARVSAAAMTVLQDPANDRFLSAATIWELAIKFGQGKIALSMPYRLWMETVITDLKLLILPITIEYAEGLSMLPSHHKDPFDRLLIAQALVENIPIVSLDAAFDPYGVTRVW